MALKVYNTLTRSKEEFKPVLDNHVGMYVCGVTVYDLCHIGHARSAIVFDVIYRYLKKKGYDVKFVKNFTDIDDKIIKRANEQSVSAADIAEKYINEYYKDMDTLGLEKPDYEPKVTDHISDIIGFIQGLVQNGSAYELNGDVYFSVRKFGSYGKLSGKDIEDLEAGARVGIDETKQDPLDFALWKKSKEKEPWWSSPWGKGRPGWHIECSVMSTKYLGETFDIHGGGMDLIFPHHENEIAQTEALTGKRFVNYWLHNGFVQINKEKMSKSLGNFFTIRDIVKTYEPQALRLFILTKHYRSPLDFTEQTLKEEEKALYRGYASLRILSKLPEKGKKELSDEQMTAFSNKLNRYIADFYNAMDDDFNTASALSSLFDIMHLINTYLKNNTAKPKMEPIKKSKDFIKDAIEILGIFNNDPYEFLRSRRSKRLKDTGLTEIEIEGLLKSRDTLRQEKKFKESDEVRAKLLNHGIAVMDTPDGTTWDIID
ncbi:MAG: cysteine--tRNA ligase [Deltaproteobacteria bacterium]|nr:cysteine--tRNA ligase [Deltaproteobacteria bacterium]MCL5791491.1 cysteine--tRNA ligase [Deltaproteobacteria bacterium]